MNWNKLDSKYIWHPFTPLEGDPPVFIQKGRGPYLITNDGRRILDGISSWWVNLHGHANKRIVRAIAKQAKKLEQVIFAGFTHEPAVKLAQRLISILPGDQQRLFFSDDGSTSVEVGLKMAIQYWHNLGTPRRKMIALEGAYHGDTFGSMSVGERGAFNLPFADHLFQVEFIPFPAGDGKETIQAIENLSLDEAAAFIFEPLVQGAAGMRMYAPGVLDRMLEVFRKAGVLCIADEVMTGFGRTGKYFACDYLNNPPDIMCLSKGITGGFLPLGVTTANQRVVEAFLSKEQKMTFYHGHSFTANPISCAAANESTKILMSAQCREAIARITASHEDYIRTFAYHQKIAEIRCLGTVLRVELKSGDTGYFSEIRKKIYPYFLERGILLRPLGNVIYVMPPYIMTGEELKKIYMAIDSFLAEVEL